MKAVMRFVENVLFIVAMGAYLVGMVVVGVALGIGFSALATYVCVVCK